MLEFQYNKQTYLKKADTKQKWNKQDLTRNLNKNGLCIKLL